MRWVSAAGSAVELLAERYERLARETPARRRDLELRTLDVILSGALLLASLPLTLPIGAAVVASSGTPSSTAASGSARAAGCSPCSSSAR